MNALATTPYAAILKDAAKVNWRVQDLIERGQTLDFSKPFLPESLACVAELDCLSAVEQLKLNQIRAGSYLHLFGLLEEAILPLVVDRARQLGSEDIEATQAYLGFATEESKHIHLFRQFAREFETGFGSPCDRIGPAAAIVDVILQHDRLGVALMTLHVEWMTQRHFLESVRDNQREQLDPQFCRLLKHHWQEEAQHARLDALMVESIAQSRDAAAIALGISDYLAIVQYLDRGLIAQVELDIASLERAIDRELPAPDRAALRQIQAASYRHVFLVSGMTHPQFVESVRALDGYDRIAAMTRAFA